MVRVKSENSEIRNFKDLKVWQKAMDISVETYRLTASFPKEEIFGLTNQIRRASNSISLNIAEGHGRNSTKSYVNFLSIANGSLCELESGLMLSQRLGFVKSEELNNIQELLIEESKMLNALMNSLEKKIHLNSLNPKS